MRNRSTRGLVVVVVVSFFLSFCFFFLLLLFFLCYVIFPFFGGGRYTKLPTNREFCQNIAFYNVTKEGTSFVRGVVKIDTDCIKECDSGHLLEN